MSKKKFIIKWLDPYSKVQNRIFQRVVPYRAETASDRAESDSQSRFSKNLTFCKQESQMPPQFQDAAHVAGSRAMQLQPTTAHRVNGLCTSDEQPKKSEEKKKRAVRGCCSKCPLASKDGRNEMRMTQVSRTDRSSTTVLAERCALWAQRRAQWDASILLSA